MSVACDRKDLPEDTRTSLGAGNSKVSDDQVLDMQQLVREACGGRVGLVEV